MFMASRWLGWNLLLGWAMVGWILLRPEGSPYAKPAVMDFGESFDFNIMMFDDSRSPPSSTSSLLATPQNTMDFDSLDSMTMYMDCLETPASTPAINMPDQGSDMTAIWKHQSDGRPIGFEQTSPPITPLTILTAVYLGISHSWSRRCTVTNGQQHKSALIIASDPSKDLRSEEQAGSVKHPSLQEGFDVIEAPANRHRCEYIGCNGKSYLRQEHLKRHYNE